ncbi:helix-turn-helix domain-containing protein [Bacillus subtilis]|nr:helix-turn-helix domain-containing protein [Bacillus subtilis]
MHVIQGVTSLILVLAANTGFSASYISKIENGKVNPSITSIETIARKLNIPMSHFF